MRTSEEIIRDFQENIFGKEYTVNANRLILETLLDIRDLLSANQEK